MELQDTFDIVHDNIIYVTNNGDYADSNNIYGISYSQSTSSSHSFDVYNNTIFTNGNYAVYLNGVSNTNVTNNGLSAYIKTGNDAVYIAGSNNNINGNYNPNPTPNSDVLNLPILKANFRNEIISESENSEKIVYVAVNKNITADGGNGSIDNPFNTLRALSNYIKNNPANYIIYFMGGNYIIKAGDALIPGDAIKGYNVTIKPYNNEKVIIFNDESNGYFIEFSFVNSFKISDICFENIGNGFIEFSKYGTSYVDNCTFKNSKQISVFSARNKLIVTNCNFINHSGSEFMFSMVSKASTDNITMNYCNFINITTRTWFDTTGKNFLNLNNCWFGYNNVNINNAKVIVSNNALFSISENQIAPGLFEITGKLMWNDTTMDGIDKLGLKTVYLSSPSGNFSDNNPVLKNGTFTVIYKSDSTAHNITAVLDNEVQNLLFNEINMSVETTDIVCGENATVSVILPANVTGNVTVNVNNKNYTKNNVNGTVIFTISDLAVGTYNVTASFVGDEAQGMATAVFKVSQLTPDLNITVNNIIFGEDLTVEVNLPADATGEVIITVDGKNYTVTIKNGKATQVVKDLTANNYTIAVKYTGNNKYTPIEITKNISVAKADANLDVSIADVDYKNIFTIEAVLMGINGVKLTGDVIININNKLYTVKVVDGKGTTAGDALAAGTYNFTATWTGNNNYNNIKSEGVFKVNKIDSNITVNADDIKVGENATVTVNVPSDATGNVIITVDGKDYTVAIVDGKAVKTIADLKANNYTVTVKYAGDNNYNPNQNTTKFTVSKISDYNMNITVPEFKEGVNSTISVVLPKDATGTVTVEINSKKYTANVTNGIAKVNIFGLSAGNHNITTTYSGDAKYDSITKKGNITVIPNVNVNLDVNDVVMIYHDGTRLVAKLTDFKGKAIVNATLYFTINGQTYNKTTDANGTASMGLNLASNVYKATVSYKGSDKYNAVSKNITVTINPTIISKDLVKMYQNDTRFYAKFTDSTGKAIANKEIKFNINGVFYTKKTDKDGMADLGIMLRPGNYILTAYNPVTGEEKGFNITVKSLIMQNDLTKYYLNASRFEATVYNKDGSLAVNKEVTFNINGVFYHKKTDENGVASLGIALRPGNYTITTMYDGLDIGNKVNVLPTLVTKDLSMKYLDGSNFTALTLDGQGKPLANQNVSFNVNGVFYHKVTNKDGIASLGIRLMAGEYIITSYWNDFQTGNTIKISS
ncbi:Ig-like domain repeat protein [Methanobrevibacter sp. TLL-48-HuF1]|nr:Ig-like domain repeat protein [Methanobrevibacter sp. TLL-48-HuF1]